MTVPCLGVTHLLFPTDDEGEDDTQAHAPEFCFSCPKSLTCLQDGWTEKFGIWGGFNVDERMQARIRKQSPEELWLTKHSTAT